MGERAQRKNESAENEKKKARPRTLLKEKGGRLEVGVPRASKKWNKKKQSRLRRWPVLPRNGAKEGEETWFRLGRLAGVARRKLGWQLTEGTKFG